MNARPVQLNVKTERALSLGGYTDHYVLPKGKKNWGFVAMYLCQIKNLKFSPDAKIIRFLVFNRLCIGTLSTHTLTIFT